VYALSEPDPSNEPLLPDRNVARSAFTARIRGWNKRNFADCIILVECLSVIGAAIPFGISTQDSIRLIEPGQIIKIVVLPIWYHHHRRFILSDAERKPLPPALLRSLP